MVTQNQVILVTGATGFVGSGVLAELSSDSNIMLRGSIRNSASVLSGSIEPVFVGELGPDTNWKQAVSGVSVIVHTAARVHLMHDTALNPLQEFRRVNVQGTLSLARQASDAGVRRFIFLSSIKVNGEYTLPNKPFADDDPPSPIDPYGISKYEAEQGLIQLSRETGMEVVIIRPVLVYGPGVKANFLSMMRWLSKGIPLPFGAIYNQRSLVALDNLVDMIIQCIDHPSAANQIFLVSDGEDLSTPDLLTRMAFHLGKKPRLLPVPQWMIEKGLKLMGKGELARRLCSFLQVDITKTKRVLQWSPPVSVDQAFAKTAKHFLSTL